jgi:hypothetical protein
MHGQLSGIETKPFDPHRVPRAIIGLPRLTKTLAQQLHFLIAAQAAARPASIGSRAAPSQVRRQLTARTMPISR